MNASVDMNTASGDISMVKKYLSMGCGVNSTALMILLEKKGIEFESVFCDTGVEYPETYEYLRYLLDKGYEITTVKPDASGCSTLEEYCIKYKIIPGRWRRWCTDKFKIQPLLNYYQKPCINFVGIAYDEKRRGKIKRYYQNKNAKDTEIRYPLKEWRISRNGCIETIKRAGLKVPRKSGCWLCPFMSRKEVIKLYVDHPDLYERRKKVEENCPRDFYFDEGGRPMSSIAPEKTLAIESFVGREIDVK